MAEDKTLVTHKSARVLRNNFVMLCKRSMSDGNAVRGLHDLTANNVNIQNVSPFPFLPLCSEFCFKKGFLLSVRTFISIFICTLVPNMFFKNNY